jgi:hypothetical protein
VVEDSLPASSTEGPIGLHFTRWHRLVYEFVRRVSRRCQVIYVARYCFAASLKLAGDQALLRSYMVDHSYIDLDPQFHHRFEYRLNCLLSVVYRELPRAASLCLTNLLSKFFQFGHSFIEIINCSRLDFNKPFPLFHSTLPY